MFTRQDGRELLEDGISEYFGVLVRQSGLPPVQLHDLRHGALSMLLAAGVDLKTVSQVAGHATAAFTADQYVVLTEELAEDAAQRAGGMMPRRGSNVAAGGENGR